MLQVLKSLDVKDCIVSRIFLCELPWWLSGKKKKNLPVNVGDTGSIPGWEDLLEKGMATHSSILAWRIPWTEEPGGPQSLGLQELDTI